MSDRAIATILARQTQTHVRDPFAWKPDDHGLLVEHTPTRTIYEFYLVRPKRQDDLLSPDDFRARLVAVAEGHPQPSAPELTCLCDEAVVMGLRFLGVVTCFR